MTVVGVGWAGSHCLGLETVVSEPEDVIEEVNHIKSVDSERIKKVVISDPQEKN